MKLVMVPINEDCTLFLYDYREEILIFKSSRNMKHLQKEELLIEKGMCYTRLYHFPIEYLKKLNN